MTDAYILDHVRTPRGRGKPDGALHGITPIQLLTQVLEAIRDRNELDTALVEDVIMGCVAPVGEQGANVARVAALNAGYAQSVPGKQLNRFCASGLEAVNTAAALVMAGQADLVIAGGVESMSRVPMGSDGGAMATDPQVAWNTYFVPQGISADLIATRYGISREDCDRYAAESQRRAAEAWQAGRFAGSILPVRDRLGRVVLDRDEHMRPGTTAEDLAGLRAAFEIPGQQAGFDSVAIQRYPDVESIHHVHTGGNSSGIVDGAAAVLVASKQMAEHLGLATRARIRAFASVGSEPTIMLTGPAPSAERALEKAKMKRGDIDLFELNEAFASVVLRYMQQLDVPSDQINVNGGAIAMGHPLGATGAMVLGTLLDEMERRDLATGLVNLCVGAGMGTATILERQ
ncbi:acetyl-CoA C-acetyltransferase [Wenzhouxiangella sp. XN24]|uniref:acetyl-CoA C-acetyltransferase n=1 Tax=Wenzhouxiangella sp. XN24 TaxID=2713569 RepID=UPI0013EB97D6|nr:acetyl-CoA C-acetyltransferase [Wenzhouxiangella sp. XN24]NGX14900.1 acetyl-CoA C-acetyltransferase [Wenzhouxiangella sp. XN24]